MSNLFQEVTKKSSSETSFMAKYPSRFQNIVIARGTGTAIEVTRAVEHCYRDAALSCTNEYWAARIPPILLVSLSDLHRHLKANSHYRLCENQSVHEGDEATYDPFPESTRFCGWFTNGDQPNNGTDHQSGDVDHSRSLPPQDLFTGCHKGGYGDGCHHRSMQVTGW